MNPLFSKQLENVSTINHEINSTLSSKVVELEPKFNVLSEGVEIIIDQDGVYHLGQNQNEVSKFVNLKIASGVNCEIYDYNVSSNLETVIDMRIEVLDNANVYYLNIDQLNQAQINREVTVATNAYLDFHNVSLNQAANENRVVIDLNGENSQANYKLITVASNETHNKYDVRVNNNARNTKADIWQKAVAKSKGCNEFLATGYIAPNCSKAENFQESRVLLLDEAAKGDASPLLLIEHHDVLAGHSAGVSRVNQEELYYLQTRGISLEEAEKLMTIAFIKPLIDEMKSEELQINVLNQINKSLGK